VINPCMDEKLNRAPCFTFTVFAPSYNRAHTLPRLYESLCQQTFKDFEWIIVDDGSTDITEVVVRPWLESAPFRVRYFKKPNGGKHTAINYGVREASGRLFAMSDSDDWYVPDALERYLRHWEAIPVAMRTRFSGVCGLFRFDSGAIVGTGLPRQVMDVDDLELRYRHRVDGDLISIKRIEVMREFPFPEDVTSDGAKSYVSEDLVWNRMGRKYLTRFVNEVFAVKEYLPGGISETGAILNLRACKANQALYLELVNSGRKLPADITVRMYANYARYSLHAGISVRVQAERVASRFMYWFCLPVGVALYRRDLFRMKGLLAN
jgi:glycosyltransferase involved in cell wall biosynthesis